MSSVLVLFFFLAGFVWLSGDASFLLNDSQGSIYLDMKRKNANIMRKGKLGRNSSFASNFISLEVKAFGPGKKKMDRKHHECLIGP